MSVVASPLDETAVAATPRSMFGLVARLPDLVSGYLPTSPVTARRRERLLGAAAGGAGAHVSARFHRSWAAFLGDDAGARSADPLYGAIEAAGARGALPEHDAVLERVEPSTRRVAEAAVAFGAAAGQVEDAARRLRDVRSVGRAIGRGTGRSVLVDAGTVLAASPLTFGLALAATAFEVVDRLAGGSTRIEQSGSRDELFVDVVAASLPGAVASAPARLVLRALPFDIVLGLVEGDHAATVRVGGGRVAVEPGLATDVVAVLDGSVLSMLGGAADAIVHEATAGAAVPLPD